MTQEALAKLVEVKTGTVTSWELNTNEPDLETIANLAAALACSAGYLAFGEGERPAYMPDSAEDVVLRAVEERKAQQIATQKSERESREATLARLAKGKAGKPKQGAASRRTGTGR